MQLKDDISSIVCFEFHERAPAFETDLRSSVRTLQDFDWALKD